SHFPSGSFPIAGGTARGPYDGLVASNLAFPHAVIAGGAVPIYSPPPLQTPDRSWGSNGPVGVGAALPRPPPPRCANVVEETVRISAATINRLITRVRILKLP